MSDNSSSPSSTSSNEENYYSAAEYISPFKGNADEESNNRNDANLFESLTALNEAAHEAMDFVNRCASLDPPKEEDETATSSKNLWTNMETVADHLENFRTNVDQAWNNAKQAHDDSQQQSGADQDDNDDNEDYDYESDGCTPDDELDTIDFSIPVNLDMEATIHVGAQSSSSSSSGEIEEEEKQDHEPNAMPAEDFRAFYMDMMTETFGDDLEELHQQGETNGAAAAVDVNILVECLESGIQFLDEKHQQSLFESLGYDGNGDEPMKESSNKDQGLTVHQVQQRRLGYLVRNGE